MEECLNPYYTGIHLALMQMAETAVVAVAVCLNPYYTGIHLAFGWGHFSGDLTIVLILIILEYT